MKGVTQSRLVKQSHSTSFLVFLGTGCTTTSLSASLKIQHIQTELSTWSSPPQKTVHFFPYGWHWRMVRHTSTLVRSKWVILKCLFSQTPQPHLQILLILLHKLSANHYLSQVLIRSLKRFLRGLLPRNAVPRWRLPLPMNSSKIQVLCLSQLNLQIPAYANNNQ